MDNGEFSRGILATVISFVLMDSLFAFNAIGKDIKPITDHWATKVNERIRPGNDIFVW